MKSATRQLDDPLDALASLPDGEPAIDAWLNVVSRLMHLPEATRADICNELREHLRERVRDLLLTGCDERRAVRSAIDELGETAQLARRFEAADQPHRNTRRLLMHAILTLVGGGAIAAGIFSLTPNNGEHANMARFGEASVVQETPKSLADARLTLVADVNMRDAVEAAAKQTKMGLMIDWGAMEEAGIDIGSPMGLSFTELAAPRALTLIAQTAGKGMTALDWRVREGGVIEFGLRHDLDGREIELVTYDITDTINLIADNFTDSKESAAQQVTELIASLVTPDYWNENGGDLAQMKLVGGRLFVEAPNRTHTKVKWILDQLPNAPGPDDQARVSIGSGLRVPILSDIPVLDQLYSTAPSDAELEAAKTTVERARDELHMIQLRYRSETSVYQAAEKRLRLAEEAFNRLQQERATKQEAASDTGR